MMYPHTITVINSFNNRGRVEYHFTEISHTFFKDRSGITLGSEVHFSKDNGLVNIPYDYVSDKEYLYWEDWEKLSDKSKHWTVKPEDYIIKGTTTETDIDDITGLRTILSFSDIDYSISINKAYRVELK